MSFGVTAVETAYAGRAGTSWGPPAFWVGEFLLWGGAAAGVLRQRAGDSDRAAVIFALAIGTYLTKVAYSPVHFGFPDEPRTRAPSTPSHGHIICFTPTPVFRSAHPILHSKSSPRR